jgi:microcystin-dependent protein
MSAENILLSDSIGNLSNIEFPKGMIVIWSGDINKIPRGWALCDGRDGRPDLRGRFVIGVNPSDARNSALSARPMNSTGGTETHTLTVEEMPSHDHKLADFTRCCKSSGNSHQTWQYRQDDGLRTLKTGGDKPHNNMPPYFALAYIMKL